MAEITPERNLVLREVGEGLFPDHIEGKEKKPSRLKALILPTGELPYEDRDALCRRTMRELYAKDEGLYLKMLPLSSGGEGAVYTATAFRHGRLFSEMIPDASGMKHRCLFGVLPGYQLLIDGFSVPDISAPLSEEYGLGKAISIARGRGFMDIRLCARGLSHPACEVKDMEDTEELYALSKRLPTFDRVILTEYDGNGNIRTEDIDIDRRDKGCVSSILSRRSGTAES